MYWIKDHRQLGETTKIFNDIDETTLSTMIEEANERESCRKEQNIKVEAMITDDFQVKLKSSIQW